MQSSSIWIPVVVLLFSQYQKCSLASPTKKLSLKPTKVSLSDVEPLQKPFNIYQNPRLWPVNPEGQTISHQHNEHSSHRIPRAVHQISLSDPLDCLSQIVCGLNTYPPLVPSARTKTANDFAYLLRNVILRLKKQDEPNLNMHTKLAPEVKKNTKDKKSKEEQNDDESEEDEDKDLNDKDDAKEAEDVVVEKEKEKSAENDDIVRLKDLNPPFGFFSHRNGRSKKSNKEKARKTTKDLRKKQKQKNRPPSPLDKLRKETDIREKLRSDARCVQGIVDHTCPFKYQELMVLTSGVLERQRTISYSTNKILPLVGYLLKSRSLTETLKSTFTALERINNITLAKDAKKEPITFNHVYDEIINGDIGDIGIRIVETKNNLASSDAWEDDEFDQALKYPVVQRKRISGYQIKNKIKDQEDKPKDTTEDDTSDSEETPDRPLLDTDNVFDEIFPNESHEADENESDNGQESQESDLPLPQVYGIDQD